MTATTVEAQAAAVKVATPDSGLRFTTALKYVCRDTKARYVAEKYREILGGSVLDVGCDAMRLKSLVARPEKYVGVDFKEPADRIVDLDRQELPFAERSFDTVIATDVLEHLERIHDVFDALCRISARHVLISLPAPINSLLQDIAAGAPMEAEGARATGWKKYYGLPVDRPGDRHRWFFGFEDAERFVRIRGGRNGFSMAQVDAEWEVWACKSSCELWLEER